MDSEPCSGERDDMSKRSRRRKRRERDSARARRRNSREWLRIFDVGFGYERFEVAPGVFEYRMRRDEVVVFDEHVPSMTDETWAKVAPLLKSLADTRPCS